VRKKNKAPAEPGLYARSSPAPEKISIRQIDIIAAMIVIHCGNSRLRREHRHQGCQVPQCMTRMRWERPYDARDCSIMETSKQFLEFAEECDRLAQEVETEHPRRILKKMADAWRKVAQEKAHPDPHS
jgi:hypothetical protein